MEAEYIESLSDDAFLSLNFKAGDVYLVLSGKSPKPIVVKLDGDPLPSRFWTKDMDSKGEIEVNEARKYDIVDLSGADSKEREERHLLTLVIPKGIQAYAFTFGMEEEGASKD